MTNEPMYETNGHPLQYSCRGNVLSWKIYLGNSCRGHRSLAGYCPWGRKEATKHACMHATETDLAAAAAKSLQSCPTLCDPIDGSLPGPAVPGILQARTLEWVAISSSNLETYTKELWLPRGRGLGGRMSWEFGVSRCRLVYTECVNKILQCSTENYIQYSVINHNGKECEK